MKAKAVLAKPYIIRWLPLAFVITLLSGLIYTALQQDIRLHANEPQLQLATDISSSLSVGEQPDTLMPKRSVDIGLSTAPFVILYNESGKPIHSSVISDGQTPTPPPGVFDYTRKHVDNRITWQPEQNVRIATVIQHYRSNNSSGFVLVGRNMREVEKNESTILQITALAWMVTITGSLGLVVATEEILRRGRS